MRRSVPSKAKIQRWSVPVQQQAAESTEPARPPDSRRDPLHGHSLADLDAIARLALRADRWHKGGDTRDRLAAIRDGIIDALLEAADPPSRRDLVAAGLHAADLYVRGEMHHHGLSIDHVGEQMSAYERYWTTSPAPSPENRVVERTALAQILPALTPAQRRALTALAWYENYELAAKACGVTASTFRVQISTARRRFLALWHQGETPAGQWRTDRRVYERAATGTHDARGRRRLTRSELEVLRGRYGSGETLTALAAEAGVHKATLSQLLRGRTRPALEPEGGDR